MKLYASRFAHPVSRGFTLIECLVYIGALFVILGLAYTAFYRCWDNSFGLKRNAEDIESALKAGERWRADVRAATRTIRSERTGDEESVRIPTRQGEVLYQFSRGELRRQAGAGTPWVVVLPHVKASRMQADSRQTVRAWRWEVELASYRKGARLRPLFSFEAVPTEPNPP